MEDRVDIIVTDKVATSIEKKLLGIAKAAEVADTSVRGLNEALTGAVPAMRLMQGLASGVAASLKLSSASMHAVSRSSATMSSSISRSSSRFNRNTKNVTANTTALMNNQRARVRIGAGGGGIPAGPGGGAIGSQVRGPVTGRAYVSIGAGGGGVPAGPGGGAVGGQVRGPITGRARVGVGAGGGGVLAAAGNLKGIGSAAKSAEASLLSLGGVLRIMFQVYFATAAAQRILAVADAYQEMSNKLVVVSDSVEQATYRLERLYDIAQESYTSLDATVTLYQRLALAMRHMNVSASAVEHVVSTVNKALIAGGANTQETTAAVRQLSQAFNKGKADGDEFRSMMENAPMLMDLVASQMGVARHELLGMAEQGKITADVMFAAFSDGAAVEEAFAKRTITVGRGLTKMGNALTMVVGKSLKSSNSLQRLGSVLSFTADHIYAVAHAIEAIAFTLFIANIGKVATALFTMRAAMIAAFAGIGPGGWIALGIFAAISGLTAFSSKLNSVQDALDEARVAGKELREELERHGMYSGVASNASAYTRTLSEMQRQLTAVERVTAESARTYEIYNDVLESSGKLSEFQQSQLYETANAIARAEARVEAETSAWNASEGALAQYRTEMDALKKLYEDSGAAGHLRKIEELQKAYDELYIVVYGTNAELKKHRQEQKLAAEYAASYNAVISATVGASREAVLGISAVTAAFVNQSISIWQAAKMWSQYLKQYYAAQGGGNESAGRPEETMFDRMESTFNTTLQRSIEQTTLGLTSLRAELVALEGAHDAGAISGEVYRQQLASINVDLMRYKIASGDASMLTDSWRLALMKLGADAPEPIEAMADIFTDATAQMTDGIGEMAAQWAVFREEFDVRELVRNVIADMIQSLVKLLTQMTINAVASKFIQTSAQASTTATMAAITASATPAAVATTIATLGAAAAQAPAQIGAATAASAAIMQSFGAKQFRDGGYTGSGGLDDVAGVVHGREFVAHARATKNNRAALEHMNVTGHLPEPKVVVNNYSGAAVSATTNSRGEIEVIVREAIARETDGVVAGALANPNSRTSRSLKANTKAGRRGV